MSCPWAWPRTDRLRSFHRLELVVVSTKGKESANSWMKGLVVSKANPWRLPLRVKLEELPAAFAGSSWAFAGRDPAGTTQLSTV
jgi:hypothetical protein